MRAALLIVAAVASALAVTALPAAAQQRQQQADTLTAEQRALQRLRELRAVAEPDSIPPPPDSITAQTVRVEGELQAVAPPSSPVERDSIMRALATIPGYIATEYRGQEARFDADSSTLVLRLDAAVAREGNQLSADSSIVYDERAALACGYGQPVLRGAGMTNPVVSDTVCFDVSRQVGFARGATTRVEQGAQWNVRCDAYFSGNDLYCHDAVFSDCDLAYPHQHYHFAADELKVVRGNVMVARDLTMKFADVPVFWLPFMVQSLSRGRRSGVLMPRFGVNDIARTSSQYSRRIEDVGLYWAINEYMGAEMAMGWFSNNWTELRGSLDYNWERRFLRGGATLRRFWRDDGDREFTISTRNSWQINERTSINVTGNYSTSTSFIESRSLDPRELNRSIDSNGSLRRRFDWGNLTLGASRKQYLSDNTISSQGPNVGLTVSPITLFEALPGEETWYSNATWRGGLTFDIDGTSVDAANANPRAQSRSSLNTGFNSSLSIGNLSWSQAVNYREQALDARELPPDTAEPGPTLVPGEFVDRGTWRTGFGYQQRLIGTSTLSPSVNISGEFIRNDSTGGRLVHAPMRVDFSAGVNSDIFGFWPGIGPFSAIRHRLSPNISYSYSPAARADSLQVAVFQREGVREQNSVSIGLTQSFEAKYHAVEADADTADVAAEAAADSVAAAEAAARGEPRRRQQTETISLLSISTNALVYDFVRAREEGIGLETTQINTTLQSDLLRGLNLSFTHDLFRQEGTPLPGENPDRTFAPRLTQANASFSLNGQSWIFRVLGLGASDTLPSTEGGPGMEAAEDPDQAGPPTDLTESESGLIGTSRRGMSTVGTRPVGEWNASIRYTLVRPRDDARPGNQMVNGQFRFQATENWGLIWNTGYSVTTGGFSDHVLSLTRTLHDWDANFHFVKAQNGNFSFTFGVNLRANPDIKLDYSQHDMQGIQSGPRPFR